MDLTILTDLPVIGIVFELALWLLDVVQTFAPSIVRSATPIAFAALCGVLCERSGVVNIGIEGTMLVAAFVGWYAGVLLAPHIVSEPTEILGLTPVLVISLVAAVLSGMLVAAVHAWLSISVKSDQIINGTIINIAAFGLTGYLVTLISSGSPESAGSFTPFRPPQELVDIPFIGWIINGLLNQGPITIALIVIVVVFQLLLFRSRWGLRTRAV